MMGCRVTVKNAKGNIIRSIEKHDWRKIYVMIVGNPW